MAASPSPIAVDTLAVVPVPDDTYRPPEYKGPYALHENGATIFTNCLGTDVRAQKFLSVISRKKNREVFLAGSQWTPSKDFCALPYLWHHKKKGKSHYFAEVLAVNSIIARELKFKSPIDYIKTRGWTCKKDEKSGKFVLRYRRLELCLESDPELESSGNYARNLRAMVDCVYDILSQDSLKNTFDGSVPFAFLNKSSFINKLNEYAQDFHCAVMITRHFFLPFVTTRHGDLDYWMKIIFVGGRTSKEFTNYIHSLLVLLPMKNTAGDGDLQSRLMSKFPTSMKDEVFRLASTKAHKDDYRDKVEVCWPG